MKERNYGIDLFKMFSMYLVVVLHVLGQGGILGSVSPLSANYVCAWSLELIAFIAVDCFALASGYVGVDAKFKPARLISLWLNAVFYGVLITAVFIATGLVRLNSIYTKAAFFPILYGNEPGFYWYLTAYAVTFLLSPFYNRILNAFGKKQLTYLVCVLLILLSVIPAIKQKDYFYLNGGYSFVWISALYIVGGYIKKVEFLSRVKSAVLVLLTSASIAVTCAGHYFVNRYAVNVLHQSIDSQADVLSNIYGSSANYLKAGMFADYTFPTTVITSVLLLVLFSRIKIKNEFVKKRVSSLVVLVFSVYLIHTNPLIFENILSGLFEGYASLNPVLTVAAVLGTALGIYAVCMMIDMLRFELFSLLKINRLAQLTESALRKTFDRLYKIGDKRHG